MRTRTKTTVSVIFALLSAGVLAVAVEAAIPRLIPFQGILTSAGGVPKPDGAYTVTFRLYDNPAGTFTSTNEPHSFGSAYVQLNFRNVVPSSETMMAADGSITYTRGIAYTIDYPSGVITNANISIIPPGTQVKVSYQYTADKLWEETKSVTVRKGVFSTSLGDTTPIPASVLFDQPYWLGVQGGTDPEMLPHSRIGAAPYAITASSLSLPYVASATVPDPGSLVSVTNFGTGTALSANSANGTGVSGSSSFSDGVYGESKSEYNSGVFGVNLKGGFGTEGYSPYGTGVVGSGGPAGVYGVSTSGNGVLAECTDPSFCGIYAKNYAGGASVAGYFPPSGNGVGVFAGDLGSFGVAAIETNLSRSTTHIWCGENSNPVFYVAGGGAVHAVSYASLSDSRYKQRIRTVANPLASIEGLRGVSFEWNPATGRSFPKGRQIGFVAQEVRKVLPELVTEDEKGYLSVEYANVVPVLVEAIKAQQNQITASAHENARLQSRLRRLEERMDALATTSPMRPKHSSTRG